MPTPTPSQTSAPTNYAASQTRTLLCLTQAASLSRTTAMKSKLGSPQNMKNNCKNAIKSRTNQSKIEPGSMNTSIGLFRVASERAFKPSLKQLVRTKLISGLLRDAYSSTTRQNLPKVTPQLALRQIRSGARLTVCVPEQSSFNCSPLLRPSIPSLAKPQLLTRLPHLQLSHSRPTEQNRKMLWRWMNGSNLTTCYLKIQFLVTSLMTLLAISELILI